MPFLSDSTGDPRQSPNDPLDGGSRIPEPRTPKDDVVVPPLPDFVSLPAPRLPLSTPLTEKFETWLANNGEFYIRLARMTREFLRETGAEKVGIQALIEAARWDRAIQTRSADYKLNNDFGAFLARLLMHDHPDLDGVFELRRADEADQWIAAKKRRVA